MKQSADPRNAVVIFSGGQDSTTCLFYALSKYSKVHTVSFDYGQRHVEELAAAQSILAVASSSENGHRLGNHKLIDLSNVLQSTSPLLSDNPVEHYKAISEMPGGVEPTFVPARNLLFITVATNYAVANDATVLITGVCEEDYGGYPDCRASFIAATQDAINKGVFEGSGISLQIDTPLMYKTKADTVRMALEFPGCIEALAFSHTCYDGEFPPNPYNHASILRARGFHEAGVADPLILRAKREGLLPADYPESGLVVK